MFHITVNVGSAKTDKERRREWTMTGMYELPGQLQPFLGEFSKRILAGQVVRVAQVIGESQGGQVPQAPTETYW